MNTIHVLIMKMSFLGYIPADNKELNSLELFCTVTVFDGEDQKLF